MALLRTQAAYNHHRGGPAKAGGPRRVLVIINPHSGQGMCAVFTVHKHCIAAGQQ